MLLTMLLESNLNIKHKSNQLSVNIEQIVLKGAFNYLYVSVLFLTKNTLKMAVLVQQS